MSYLTLLIGISLIISGNYYSNPNVYWLAGLFTIISLIFFVYEHINDVMPEPKQKKTFTLEKVR